MLIKHACNAFVCFQPALLTYLLRNKIFVTPAMISRQFPDFLNSSLECHFSFKFWKRGKKLHDVSCMFYFNRLYFVEQVNYLYKAENVPKTCRWYEGSRMVTNASDSPKKANNLTLSASERWEFCVSVIVSVFCFVFVSFQPLFGVQGEDETLLDILDGHSSVTAVRTCQNRMHTVVKIRSPSLKFINRNPTPGATYQVIIRRFC